MDTYYLRQQMLAKLEEFKLYQELYEENTKPQLAFIRENLEVEHRKDLEEFLTEKEVSTFKLILESKSSVVVW